MIIFVSPPVRVGQGLQQDIRGGLPADKIRGEPEVCLENAAPRTVQELGELLSEVSLILNKLLKRLVLPLDLVDIILEGLIPGTNVVNNIRSSCEGSIISGPNKIFLTDLTTCGRGSVSVKTPDQCQSA